jgi:hypothetical protein
LDSVATLTRHHREPDRPPRLVVVIGTRIDTSINRQITYYYPLNRSTADTGTTGAPV